MQIIISKLQQHENLRLQDKMGVTNVWVSPSSCKIKAQKCDRSAVATVQSNGMDHPVS